MACMDATQQIEDSFFGEEDDSEPDEEQREPLAVLKVFKNNHIPETEVPLYQGENVLGRDPASCTVPLQACSVSGLHAVISISVFGPNERRAHSEATEALLWDLGSLNGTRKGRLKLTPQVRYALTEGDIVVLADLPCQYVSLKSRERNTADGREHEKDSTCTSSRSEGGMGKSVEKLPPVPVWGDEPKMLQSPQTTPKVPERTLVPESDSDSDGEKHGRREKRKILASDSVSSELSSPTCSTFLTPANKVIPESEDESSITPSPALKGRFSKTGNDTEVSSDSPKPEPLHFNIDSDTDVEDEEVEMTKAAPGIEAVVTEEVNAVNPAALHMDSDTDVEEEETEKAKSDPAASASPAKQDSVNPAALTMDSDTDVEENEPVKTAISTLSSRPEAALDEKTEPSQFHMESDTDVEDEDEDVSHIQDSRPPTSHDVEEDKETTKAIETPCEVDSKDLEKKQTNIKDPIGEMLHHQSESDTDMEDDVAEIRTPGVAKGTANCPMIQNADEHSTDARHDSPVQVQPPAVPLQDEFRLDSDTDVDEEEEKMEEEEQKCEEAAVKIVFSSTPQGAGLSEEELETQAFLSPSQLFKRPGLPSVHLPSVSPGGISNTDSDFTVAETQSFVCDAAQDDAMLDETQQSLEGPESLRSIEASSIQPGLSDSGHRVPEAEEHDREPAEEDWQLQATQLYAMTNPEGSTKTRPTQDLDATQAYLCQEEEEGVRKKEEEEEMHPLKALGHSSTHAAETQLIKHRGQDEDNSDCAANEEVVASEPGETAEDEEEEDNEMLVDSHLSTADTLLIIRSPRQEEQTQPYAFLAAQIQKEQEMEKEECEGSDKEVQEKGEGERTQNETNESVGQENDEDVGDEGRERKESERVVLEKKSGVTIDGPELELKERVENKNDSHVNEEQMQPAEAETIVETLPICEEEDGQEEEENKPRNSRRHCRRRQTDKEEPKQPVKSDKVIHVTIAETQPVCEEDEEGQEEEQLNEPISSRGTQPYKVESTQPLEPNDHTRVVIPETFPMDEEEEKNKPGNSRRPGRRRQTAKVEPKQPVESDHVTPVTTAETQPVCEEDEEGQEEERQSEAVSTQRSSVRRRNAEAKPVKPEESHVTMKPYQCTKKSHETLPMYEEQEEMPKCEAKPGRKSCRGRQTAKTESTQPLEPESALEPEKVDEEEEKNEDQDSRRSLRGKARGKAAPGKGKGRGRPAAGKEKRGNREEEVKQGNQGRRRKNLRQKSKDYDQARLELVETENEERERLQKQKEEEESKRLQREEKKEEAQLERESKDREERRRLEREEKEEREKREQEEKDRLERERIEKEQKEREEKEMKEREVKRLEKERRAQEEQDKLEKERIEKEKTKKEEKEKLEKERQELEEKLERERKEQEVKERLAREKRDGDEKERLEKEMREEKEKLEMEKQKEKESKNNKTGGGKEKRQAAGKRKMVLGRKGEKGKNEEELELEEGTKERLEPEQELTEIQKPECEEGNSKKQEDEAESEAKPRRGRRTTRKSLAPPTDVEDEGGPAKRTRSRSNSSNSVCSEKSTQDSLSEERRRGARRKTTEEVNERSRRRTSTAPSTQKEDIKQAALTRSNSRSSDRSNSSVATPSRGRGGKGRKSGKTEVPEEVEEKEEQSGAVGRGRGRGRGRGGKRPGEKEEAEVIAVAEGSVTSQSSRGRKRGADVSLLVAETPQPTPKTPRRSLAGQTHKVLFTGVVDEDGEKVLLHLGGGMAKGVGDMTHLVTDKVRRTVKFLCAVARGVPIVTPDWLSKCGKAGSFLSPNGFLVKDVEQEKRFNFSLQEALRVACSQPLLQGYEIHVTPSVKPEPAQMKEIITCCGARFLPKMPSAHKAQTVVVSCEEDRTLCERARSLSFPVVSAEFLLTGILQQKVDLQTHALALSPGALIKPTSRSRGK